MNEIIRWGEYWVIGIEDPDGGMSNIYKYSSFLAVRLDYLETVWQTLFLNITEGGGIFNKNKSF